MYYLYEKNSGGMPYYNTNIKKLLQAAVKRINNKIVVICNDEKEIELHLINGCFYYRLDCFLQPELKFAAISKFFNSIDNKLEFSYPGYYKQEKRTYLFTKEFLQKEKR